VRRHVGLGGDEHEHAAVVEGAHVGLRRGLVEARVDEQALERAVPGNAGVLAAVRVRDDDVAVGVAEDALAS
jgi:hypothetical protein